MADINDEWLTADGMMAAHVALTARYRWFLHCTPVERFHLIKTHGLEPRNPCCAVNAVVAASLNVANVSEMIFLRPMGTSDSTPRRGSPLCTVAISAHALPATITVDWTFGGTWELGPIISADCPSARAAEVFCEVARRRASIAIYEAIPPGALRAWTKDCPQDDPATWPNITEVQPVDLALADGR